MWGRQEEHLFVIGCDPAAVEVHLQGGNFRTFNVDPGFIDALAIQTTPQRGTRNENFPPVATYVGQLDRSPVPVVVFPVVRDQGEEFWRDC